MNAQPANRDLMISIEAMEKLDPDASVALQDLFLAHGRRAFKPDTAIMPPRWSKHRGGRQKFARAIAWLHLHGHLKWLPGNRYKVVSLSIQTGAEYRANYPNATYGAGISWPEGEAQT